MIGFLLLSFFAILPLAVVIMIIVAIVKRSKNGDTHASIKSFEKTIRSIYAYIILICLVCTIIAGTIYLFNSVLSLVIPDKQVEQFNESGFDEKYNYNDEYNVEFYDESISDDKYNYEYGTTNLNRDRNENIVGIVTSFAMLVSCIPLFIYFNKLARKNND